MTDPQFDQLMKLANSVVEALGEVLNAKLADLPDNADSVFVQAFVARRLVDAAVLYAQYLDHKSGDPAKPLGGLAADVIFGSLDDDGGDT
jgi:hypothetical protein